MRNLSRLVVSVAPAVLLWANPAQADEELHFGAAPDWVVPYTVPQGEEIDADLPIRALETDFQTRLEAGRTSHYISVAIQFLAPQGLQAGNLAIVWRPEFDTVTVHGVTIEREGEAIDVLADGQEFAILRREENLDVAMLTGALTANLFPAGLQVGDVLRFAYTIELANPVMGEFSEATLGPLNGIVDSTHVRLSWPRSMNLRLAATADLPPLEQGRDGDFRHATLTMPAVPPVVLPDGAPGRYALVRMLEASSFADWAQLSAHFAPLYAQAEAIPASGPLRDRLEAIRSATEDPRERTERALALVQDQVRYVALAMGAAGLVPADTTTTWARRFGDCKAKSALLIGLLHELGIAAEPVLVSTQLGDALPQRLPMVGAFDHVIVRAHIDGQDYFLDGTRSDDRSLARITVPAFSWGLPVQAEGATLVPLVPAPLDQPTDVTMLAIDLSQGIRAPAPTTAEVIYRGEVAIAVNLQMAQLYGQARNQAIESYWSDRYRFFTPTEVGMRFDEATGELHFTASGTSQIDWSYNSFEPVGMRVGYDPDFDRPAGADPDAPFATGHPFYDRTSYQVTLPPGFSADLVDGSNVDRAVAGVEYRRELALADNRFTAMRSARSLVPEITAAQAHAAEDDLRVLRDGRVFLRIPANYRLSQAEVSSMARAEGTDASDLLNQGIALMDAGEWSAARSVFDRVVAIDPRNAWAHADRAVTLARLGEVDAAQADIVRTRELDPGNYVVSHAEGVLATLRMDWPAAVRAFSDAIAAHDRNYWAVGERARANASAGDLDAALDDAEVLIGWQPDNSRGYLIKGFILAQAGRGEQLQEHVARMRARFPDDPGIVPAASAMLDQAGLAESARELIEDSIAAGPHPMALVTRAQQRGRGENALKLADLDEALAIDPDFIPALAMRGRVYWEDYELERALADADRVIELQPTNPIGYDLRIIVLLDMERNRDAIATVDRMVERFPGNPIMLRVAASHYRELRQFTKYEQTIARARELAPDMDDSLEIVTITQ